MGQLRNNLRVDAGIDTGSVGRAWAVAAGVSDDPLAQLGAIYSEPKSLVAHGLATSHVEDHRDRRRTRYTITAACRHALASWLGQPSAAPQFLSEAHVRVGFAESGSKDDVL